MSLILFAGFLLFAGVFIAGTEKARAQEHEAVSFRWAFGARTQVAGEPKLVNIESDTVLTDGDQLKMMIEPATKCFIYLLHHSEDDGVSLLFPYNLHLFDTSYKPLTKYFVPPRDVWFSLDTHHGREVFYLLASSQRLMELENLLKEHEVADAVQKPELAKKILMEVRNLKRRYQEFAGAAERPVTTGGSVRGLERKQEPDNPDVSVLATEISTPDFYSRTFSIDHR